jgi:hypothetical protein
MAQRVEHHPLDAAFAALLDYGLDGAGEALRILVDEASKIERAHFLNAQPHERTLERADYANGFKPKTVMTRVGSQTFAIPQVCGGGFYPSALEKGTRTERAVDLALAEMYVQGVSTRKVITLLQSLLGPDRRWRCPLPRSAVPASSSTPGLPPGGTDPWTTRPRSSLMLATNACARLDGWLIAPSWFAIGITTDGRRRVLGVSVALSEAEVHWRGFIDSLIARGLRGVKLILSDDHSGLKAARRATLPSVPWQRCQFHLQQNAQAYVTRLDQRQPVAQRIRAIFNAPDKAEAERALKQAVALWEKIPWGVDSDRSSGRVRSSKRPLWRQPCRLLLADLKHRPLSAPILARFSSHWNSVVQPG